MESIAVKLEAYEGPLDILLGLINKNKINIYDIPIHMILGQYMEQIKLMERQKLNVTADFLSMAAHLVFIKSAMLLPRYEDEEGQDPREELVRLLLEYSRYKTAAESFREMSAPFYNVFIKSPDILEIDKEYGGQHSLDELLSAYNDTLKRTKRKLPPPVTSFTGIVSRSFVTVSSRTVFVLKKLLKNTKVSFGSLFVPAKSRSEIVATFLAVLELTRSGKIHITQDGQGRDFLSVNMSRTKIVSGEIQEFAN